MYAASAEYQSTVRDATSYTRVIKVEQLLAADLSTVLATLTGVVTGGDIRVTQHRDTRRQLTGLTIANDGGIYTPRSSSDVLWMNNVLRIWDGIVLPSTGAIEYVPVGVFRINKPEPTVEAGAHIVRVDGVDLWKQLHYTGLLSPLRFAKGSSLGAIFRGLAVAAGIPLAKISIDQSLEVTFTRSDLAATDITFYPGLKVADCLTFMATNFMVAVSFDPLANLVVRPQPVYSDGASVWTFAETHQGVTRIAGGYEDSVDIANHVGVRSSDPSVGPVYAQVSDQNVSSPTYIGGPLGDRYVEYKLDGLQSAGQCARAATLLLQRRVLPSRKISPRHRPYAFLDGEDIVTVTSSEAGVTNMKGIVDTMTIPLTLTDAETSVFEVRPLG